MASPWTTRHRRRAQWEELVTARFVVGDVRKVLASLPDQSVDLVFSSPPFLGLRSYLPPDHPNKSLEIGSEATPADYIDTLLDVVEDCARLLAPHGSLAFELGDTYATSLNQRKAADNDGALWNGAPPGVGRSAAGAGEVWPLPKSLCGIPELFAFSLAYGRNLLRPERTTEPWRIRNLIAWTRPNPPVGALGDKVRPATSYITVAAKSAARWWDMDAVRSTPTTAPQRRLSQGTKATTAAGGIKANSYNPHTLTDEVVYEGNPAGAPLLDWWPVPTKPYRGAHYATFPDELARRAILLMCPLRVCTLCGEPSKRVTQCVPLLDGAPLRGSLNVSGRGGSAALGFDHNRSSTDRQLLGWSHCSCGNGCRPTTWRTEVAEVLQYQGNDSRWVDADEWGGGEPLAERIKCKQKRVLDDIGACADPRHWRPGIVLDPFAGSGTTLAVASGNGRDSIGIDLDERNVDLALDRVGPLLLQIEDEVRRAG